MRPRLLLATALAATGALTAACGGPVEVDVPELTAAEADICAGFAADLPDELAEEPRGDIEPSDAPAAAYGDPAIVVRCGVPEPDGFDLTASCESANGVGYYLPDEQYEDQDLDLTITTAGYEPRIEIVVPSDYRPNGGAAAMAALAPLVEAHLTLVEPCD
ncbi:DUF3515 family protein [Nocardioides caeni]|uniref:DUF3515 domain-containing protein n=1 Tax=Nocardioides caeni TaxID=574700 RepID=A0A4S8NQ93_9ACTN|nr:DUF3515 family protein [Nocardioides caeni]THV17739.1 DUF3515 domain-containing protein [Nocardioides caeni]